MKEKTYGIILGIVNMILLVICGVFSLGKDKNAPQILLPEGSRVYAAQKGTDMLFEGVTAFDEEDGELTDSVVIEKIVTDEEKRTATITYGVADNAGNVGKVTCTVVMTVDKGNISEKDSEGRNRDTGLAEDRTETVGDSDETSSEENRSEPEEREDSESERENSEDEEKRNNEALPVAGEADNTNYNSSLGQNQGKPSMVFRKQEVKTKAGSGPAWVDVIEGLHDDKDNYETLLKSLTINGTYDRNKAGTYDITVTVTDSDGNVSGEYPMKIVVEE